MFKFHYIIGKGGFGNVWKVVENSTKQNYAIKEMSKAKIIMKKSVQSVMLEKTLLEKITCDFIV